MTTESTQPQPEQGLTPDMGQVQSQKHRRRRRRRKNKAAKLAAMQAVQGQQPQLQPQMQMQPPIPAQMPASVPQQASPKPSHQHQSRKKKKFFQKSQAPAAPPGNSVSGPPKGQRKMRQRGPRTFIGPMDHSYRAVNGNVADGPPSTIPLTGNGHGGAFYADAYVPSPPAAR